MSVMKFCTSIKQIKELILMIRDIYTAQKMKFSINNFFSKCGQIRSFLRIWSHLLKKSLIENFIFCAVLGARKRPHNKTSLKELNSTTKN